MRWCHIGERIKQENKNQLINIWDSWAKMATPANRNTVARLTGNRIETKGQGMG